MARPENPIDPHAGPLADFAAGLRRLRNDAGLTYRELSRRAHTSASALSQAASGHKAPSWEVTAAFVQACGGDLDAWRKRWGEVGARATTAPDLPAPTKDARGAGGSAGGVGVELPPGEAPTLSAVMSVQDFHAALKTQRLRAGGPSLRELESSAQRQGHVLRRSTLSDTLGRTSRLPPLEFVDAYLSACKVAVSELADWHAAWARVAYLAQGQPDPRPAQWRDRCPYQGLGFYGPEEAGVFYGREKATAELVARVAETVNGAGILVLTGPSGAGKSSLLRAGLLPELAKGALGPGSRDWPHLVMAPGAAPLQQLASGLAALAGLEEGEAVAALAEPNAEPDRARLLVRQALAARPGAADAGGPALRSRRLVLVVDQFEEVFTSCPDRLQRDAFISALGAMAGAAAAGAPPAVVILSVRGDFFGHCASYAPLARVMQTGTFVVGPLTESELRSTITGPAAAAGLLIEVGLVDNILADLRSAETGSGFAPAVLPLLSHALLQTWQHREGNRLTHRAYAAIGGLADSIAASAEAAYRELTPGQQTAAMLILRRMVTIPRDGVITRRRIQLSELDTGRPPEDVSAALTALTRSRLVSVSEETAEITHETVLRSWPRLNAWLESSRAEIGLLTQLAEATQEWTQNKQDPDFLYQGSRLDRVREGVDPGVLSAAEGAFLRASLTRAAQLRRSARRRRRSFAVLSSVLAVLLAFSLVAACAAYSLKEEAQGQHRRAVSQRVAAQSELVGEDAELAGLLSVAGWRIAGTPEARDSMIAAIGRYGEVVAATISLGKERAAAVAFSPDGRTVAVADRDAGVLLWDISRPKKPSLTSVYRASATVGHMVFSPDGRTLAATTDHDVEFADVATAKRRARVTASGRIEHVALSPDGRHFAAVDDDRMVRIWDISDLGSPVIRLRQKGTQKVTALSFAPDGRTLATAGTDGVVRLWDVTDPAPLRPASAVSGHTDVVRGMAFTSDGRTLATAGADRTVRLWDVTERTRPRLALVLTGHTGTVHGVAFSPDGRTLATASADNTVRLWDPTAGRPAGTLTASTDGISRVAFSPDNRGLLTIGSNGRIQQWTIPAQADPDDLIRTICSRAGRELTRTEWQQHVRDYPYEFVCSRT
ncbi:WD40 repeat domain-containing protein [Streptomyces sp. AC550_RSS872]|uniref:WD40 repeat domain-containing protein n=1 Tax=Streptomyces sp. AC550_RSS872 TaxID=2823689 RepID=UPI001C267284|nr:WD40 repeat domain-containing protein [Streptomyces sp. AC550_RSS872]